MNLHTTAPQVLEPKFNGNADLPEDKRIRVYLKYPTNEEFERLGFAVASRLGQSRLVAHCAVKIENLSFNERAITTGKELTEAPYGVLWELVSEIFIEIMRGHRLDEEREKNSEGQSS